MTKPSDAEIEAIKGVFDGINANDVARATKDFAIDAKRIEPAGHDTAGTYVGANAIAEHLKVGRSTWAEGTCEPVDFHADNGRVIAFLHVKVRLKDKTDWIDGRIADVFTFKDGKITEMRTFWENDEALAWVSASKI